MFKITPIQTSEQSREYAKLCNTEYRDGYFAYVMLDCDSGEVMGFSQFEVAEGFGYISDIKEREGRSDFEAMIILGRSTMSFLDMIGVNKLRAPLNSGDEALMLRIGFEKIGDQYFADTRGAFNSHCSGH